MNLASVLLFLSISCLSSTQAIALPWPFKPKVTSTIKVDLQDYTGVVTTEDTGVVGVRLIYDFSGSEDRVWIESETYPELSGKPIFEGQIKSVALSEKDFDKTLSRIAPEIRKRIEFFPSYLNKREYATWRTKGKKVALQTQSFFTDQSKTYLLDFDYKNGLAQLEIDKVYERPAEIAVFKSMGEVGRRHFLVTVRYDRPGLISLNDDNRLKSAYTEKALSTRIEESLKANRRDPKLYYEPFMSHLRKENQYKVFRAVQDLIANQNNPSLGDEDYKNLKTIDSYLIERGLVNTRVELYPTQSKARRVGDAFEMRFLSFGLEPHEAWLFQFEPHLQEVENDFVPLPIERSKSAAFTRTDRGIVLMRSYINDAYLIEYRDGTDHVHVTMSYPDTGMSRGDEFSFKVSTNPEIIDQKVLEQKRSGLQGNGDYYNVLLGDVCSNFLKP